MQKTYDAVEAVNTTWEIIDHNSNAFPPAAFYPVKAVSGTITGVKATVKGVKSLVNWTKNLIKGNPCDCFTAGTKVLTDEGEKPIEEIEVGDRVLAKSDETGEVDYKEVVGLFQKQADEIYYVHIGDEIIEVTGEHPFWLNGKGWTLVKDLKVGDLLVSSDGATLAIDRIEKEPREATVYNFEVKDFNSYFVSNLGIWVHNCLVVDSVIKETLSSTGNITSKYTLTTDEALSLGKKLLGDGYKEIGKSGSGVFEKVVGNQTYRFRIDNNSIQGNHAPNVPHVHVEILDKNRNVIVNNHIPFLD